MAVNRIDSVSSSLSHLDRRLNTVESRTLGLSGISSGVTTAAPADTGGSSVTPGPGITPPKTYTKIIKAYIYGDQTTGAGSRIELYFATPLKTSISLDAENNEVITPLAPGETMRIQGLHSTSGDDFIISPKDFIVQATDTPPWDDADLRLLSTGEVGPGQLRRSWRNTPSTGNNKPSDATAGETVEFTTWFNPVLAVPKTYTGATELITTRRIDSVSATGSTVTVTLNSTNKFKVGDVIYIDQLSASAPASTLFGIDGLFKVTATPTSTSIQYELDAPLASPITNFVPATYKYVYPVAQPKVEEGEVWVDKSVEPNRVFVWKELRWYDTADPIGQVTPEQDGIAPSPVTDLAATTELPAGSTSPVINLTWTPPTTRSNGDPISGFLDGYDIWYKRSTESVWKKEFVKDGGQGIAAHQIKDAVLLQNFTYNIRVYAVDIMAQYSTAATVNILTAKYSEVLNPPSKPTVSSRLGTITVSWDGNDSTGNLPVPGVLYVEVHQSTTSGFTPSAATLVTTLPNNPGGDYTVLSDLSYGTTYYFKLIFVRQISPTETESSAASTQSDAIQVAPLVDADVIANTISGAKIQSGTITASDKIIANTITGALIQALAVSADKIQANAITADKIDAGAITAKIVSGDVIRAASTLTANARVELRATGIYAYNSVNDSVFSFNTQTSTLTIGGYATSSDLSSGLNGKISNGGAANDVNVNTTTISGGKITTGTIDATRITVTDTFRYLNTSSVYEVALGQNAIGTYGGSSAGVNFKYSGSNSGYIGTWGAGNFELGKDFFSSYISLGLGGGNSLSMKFDNGYTVDGTTFTSLAAMAVNRTSTAALYVGDTSSTTTRAFLVSTSGLNVLVGNGGGSWPTTNQSFDVYGRIRATGTITQNTSLSSSRFKTDIRDYQPPESLYDIVPKIFKYNNKIRYESWKEYPKDEPEFSDDHLGAIAEDFIEAGLGYLVSYDSLGRPEALDYSKIAVLLIPEIKMLKLKVKELENRVGH